ncbi:unnamed protein product, partial [Brassica napus]
MRVQINGRLPLIKKTTLEYSNGDEVVATLVYERLEKHCAMCLKLDHELRVCLEAKAQKKALAAEAVSKDNPPHHQNSGQLSTRRPEIFQFSSSEPKGGQPRGDYNRDRHYYQGQSGYRQTSYHSRKETNESDRYSQQSRNRREYHSRDQRSNQMVFREVRRKPLTADSHRRDSAGQQPRETVEQETVVASHPINDTLARGIPLQSARSPRDTPQQHDEDIPQEALKNAMGGIREYMIQYANCPDRTESAARKERLRQAEEQGEIEETALQMVRASLATHTDEPPSEKSPTSADRVPAKHRLGPTPSAKLRLGPAPGPSPEPAIKKRLGRPPGTRKVAGSPTPLIGTSLRKRK